MEIEPGDIIKCGCGKQVLRTKPGQNRCWDCEGKNAPAIPQTVISGRTSSMVPFYCDAPPSANRAWFVNGEGAHTRSDAYNKWLRIWKDPCFAHFGQIIRRVRLYIDVDGGEGFDKRRDLDNIAKPIQDLLAKHSGVLQNDTIKQVKGVRLEYHDPKEPNSVHRVGIRLEQL